jgi:hypothetical protein
VTSTACLNPTGGYIAIGDPQFGGSIIPANLEYIHYTSASGTTISGMTRGLFGSTALAWNAYTGGNPPFSVVDGVVALQTLSTSTVPNYAYFQDGAQLAGNDAGQGYITPSAFSHGPSETSSRWLFSSGGFIPIDSIGGPCFTFGPNWDMGNWPTIRCDAVQGDFGVGNFVFNHSTSNTAMAIMGVGNDDAVDGGSTSALTMSITSAEFGCFGSMSPTMCLPNNHLITATGGPLWIGSSESANNIDPVIHFQYGVQQNGFGVKNTDDAHIDSAGFHVDDIATPSGIAPVYASTNGLLSAPGGVAVTATGGLGLTPNCTANGGCNLARGEYAFTGTQVGTGIAATLSWAATPTAFNCMVQQDGVGGATNTDMFVGHSTPTTTGMVITVDGVTSGTGFTVDYICQP